MTFGHAHHCAPSRAPGRGPSAVGGYPGAVSISGPRTRRASRVRVGAAGPPSVLAAAPAAALAVALAAGAAGCSSPTDAVPSSTASSVAASATPRPPTGPDADPGTVPLSELGFRNGPEGFRVPSGLVLSGRVDQTNVVTFTMDGAQGRRLHEYLMTALPSMGWTIEGSSGDSIVFSASGWEGAFTMSDEQAGLTLRRLGSGPSSGGPG